MHEGLLLTSCDCGTRGTSGFTKAAIEIAVGHLAVASPCNREVGFTCSRRERIVHRQLIGTGWRDTIVGSCDYKRRECYVL